MYRGRLVAVQSSYISLSFDNKDDICYCYFVIFDEIFNLLINAKEHMYRVYVFKTSVII